MRQLLSPPLLDRSTHPLSHRTVLQIVPSLDGGDAGHIAIEAAAAIAAVGGKALVASEGGRLVSALQAMGGLWMPFPAASREPLAMLLNVRRLARLIEQENVDIIHAHSRAAAWVAYGAARRTKTPLVTTFHSGYIEETGLQQRYNSIMARGDCIIAHSHYTARLIEARYPHARRRIKVIPAGIDFQIFAPQHVEPSRVQALRENWGIAPDQRIVLFTDPFAEINGKNAIAGSHRRQSGQPTFIEAARMLHDQGLKDAIFILAGNATPVLGHHLGPATRHEPERPRFALPTDMQAAKEFERRIATAGLSRIMRRATTEADLPAALLASAAVVAPMTQPEGFGPLAIAAQAMGTPMILPALGAAAEIILAPPEVIDTERTGWLVPPGDSHALASTIAEVLALGATARGLLSERGRRQVEARFSLDTMCQDTLAAYASLLGGDED
ncbi:glycosyltransferase [Beijerinckia mobilis]|uniref:glycosyltransferase n=1 Tax=Beijerinckia mobilis TaxID=231434 RepID=UPI000A003720|nr:glycosyltransferase [Beijerinckia mobilis]